MKISKLLFIALCALPLAGHAESWKERRAAEQAYEDRMAMRSTLVCVTNSSSGQNEPWALLSYDHEEGNDRPGAFWVGSTSPEGSKWVDKMIDEHSSSFFGGDGGRLWAAFFVGGGETNGGADGEDVTLEGTPEYFVYKSPFANVRVEDQRIRDSLLWGSLPSKLLYKNLSVGVSVGTIIPIGLIQSGEWLPFEGGGYPPYKGFHQHLPSAFRVLVPLFDKGKFGIGSAISTDDKAGSGVYVGHGLFTEQAEQMIAARNSLIDKAEGVRKQKGFNKPSPYSDDLMAKLALISYDMVKNLKIKKMMQVPVFTCPQPDNTPGA